MTKVMEKVALNKGNKKVKQKEDDIEGTEKEKAKQILQHQIEQTDKELNKIKQSSKGKVGQVYEIARTVRGGKVKGMKAVAIINPENGKLAVDREEIKNVSFKYCKTTLKNNPPHNNFRIGAEIKEELHRKRMTLGSGSFNVCKEELHKVITKFKSGNKRNYDYLVKAGTGFHENSLKLCHRMFREEKFPDK